MLLQSLLLVASALGARAWGNEPVYKYVAAFSIDGFHSSDVEKYVAVRPKSTIASLLATGYEYTDAYTSGPSDSFPGSMNFVTGASPRTTGVWYDDTYDRTFWSPFSITGTYCQGPPGAEGQYLTIPQHSYSNLDSDLR
jgi:predicted AlkP superfamily pyrophosphatase or phosphodiesterase